MKLGDEFSSDEFSDGEFDSLSNTYENLKTDIEFPKTDIEFPKTEADIPKTENVKNDTRTSPEGAEDFDDNVYDVAEFVENGFVAEDRKNEIEQNCSNNISSSQQQQVEEEEEMEKVVDKKIDKSIDNEPCLIENEGEKTIIFTSAAVASSQSKHNERNFPARPTNEKNNNRSSSLQTSEHQILISSSSWIDLQGNSSDLKSEEENYLRQQSQEFGSLPLVSCKFGGSVPADVCKLEVGSISIGARPHLTSEWSVSADPGITLDSLEPVKPPRLKKIARLQQQQQQQHHQQQQYHHHQQQQHDLLRHVMHRDKLKMSNRPINHHHHHRQQQQQRQQSVPPRPDISAPILLATTLNPNDADAHRTLSAFSAGSILSHLEQLNRQQRHLPPSQVLKHLLFTINKPIPSNIFKS